MRHHLAAGVVATVFLLLVDAGQAQVGDCLRDLGRHLALEVDEVAPCGELAVELVGIHLEQARELAHLGGLQACVRRQRPDCAHRRAHREDVAMAVGDAAAGGGHLEHARIARCTLGLEEIVIDPLQVERTPDQCKRTPHQREHDDARPPCRQLALEQRIVIEGDGTLLFHD